MESLRSFQFCFRNVVRLGLAAPCNHRSQTFRRFSEREEQHLWEDGSPCRAGPKEVSHLHTDSFSDRAESGGAARPNQKPLLVRKPCRDRRLQTPVHQRWKLPGKGVSGREEEFWNLRNDDFSKRKGQSQPRLLQIGRTEGSEILFGIAPCSLALARSKRDFFKLFLKSGSSSTRSVMEDFSRQAEALDIPVQLVPRKVLDTLCKGGVHQGVCLEATPLRPISWQEGSSHEAEGATSEGSQLLWLALEGIQDPMNLGAVLRSAHFLGVDGIVMSQRNSCPLTPVVSKASAGAMEVLDVFGMDHLQSFLQGTIQFKELALNSPTDSKGRDWELLHHSAFEDRFQSVTVLVRNSRIRDVFCSAWSHDGSIAQGLNIFVWGGIVKKKRVLEELKEPDLNGWSLSDEIVSNEFGCPRSVLETQDKRNGGKALDAHGRSSSLAKSEQGWEIVGTVGHSTAQGDIPVESCLDFRWTKPTVLLLGNEGYGLSPETKSLCRRMLSIFPGRELQPGIESLNVSVAAGILLHSICSQKVKAT